MIFFLNLILTLILMLHACDGFQPIRIYGFFLIAKIHYFSYLNMGLANHNGDFFFLTRKNHKNLIKKAPTLP